MNRKWKGFILVESAMLLLMLYQLITNFFLLVLVTFGAGIIYKNIQQKKEVKRSYSYVTGGFLIIFGLFSTSAAWGILIVALLFFAISGRKFLEQQNISPFKNSPWNKKDIMVLETTDSRPKSSKRLKRRWWGNERIGSSVFEWDDINFSILMGDTIIDLGNTLLPKEESYIVVRKGFGKTRLLVPSGVGIMLEHSAVKGKVTFEGETFELENESVKMYSKEFEKKSRKLKVITNVLIGDLEVISL